MIVVDASTAVLGLLNDGQAREDEPLVCPHLVDSDVAHALRSQVLRARSEGRGRKRNRDLGQSNDHPPDCNSRLAAARSGLSSGVLGISSTTRKVRGTA